MKIINVNTRENLSVITYPDGQPHVTVENIKDFDEVLVVCSMITPTTILELAQVANALDHLKCYNRNLYIPYLMAARYDRMMGNYGESFDLEVIANIVNSLNFVKVYIRDVHSQEALWMIENSFNLDNRQLVELYNAENAVLICPDKGAKKKMAQYIDWNKCFYDTVFCEKSRDLTNGHITLEVHDPWRCKGQNCVIIDDICDGGATFINIAKQIQAKHLTLIVTHGIFSKGTEELGRYFDQIITSDTYYPLGKYYFPDKVRVINFDIKELL